MNRYYLQIYEYLEKLTRQLVQADHNGSVAADTTVSLMEYFVMRMLMQEGGQTFRQLMDATGWNRNGLTGALRRLLKQQLVEKEPVDGDKRSRRLQMTEKGRALILELDSKSRNQVYQLLNDFTFNEEKAVLKFLVKLEMIHRQEELAKIRQRHTPRAK